jgi:hypothetical protein
MAEIQSVEQAVLTGDRLKSITALRDKLARAIDECESLRDLPPLSARLSDVLIQIEALSPKVEVGDAVDEITARRAARRAGTA